MHLLPNLELSVSLSLSLLMFSLFWNYVSLSSARFVCFFREFIFIYLHFHISICCASHLQCIISYVGLVLYEYWYLGSRNLFRCKLPPSLFTLVYLNKYILLATAVAIGSVGKAAASVNRGSQFESNQWHIQVDKWKKKPRMVHLKHTWKSSILLAHPGWANDLI